MTPQDRERLYATESEQAWRDVWSDIATEQILSIGKDLEEAGFTVGHIHRGERANLTLKKGDYSFSLSMEG